jgi:uncharacterized protein HemX
MKNSILKYSITAVILAAGITAFGQQNTKTAMARKNVAASQNSLREAKIDSAADYQKFRKEAERNIADNQKSIAKLKERKASERKDVKDKYDAMVVSLEKDNNSLQKKIDNSSSTKTDMWSRFKLDFNHEMANLKRAIEDND